MTDSEWLRLTLAVLATWRLSRLVAFEDGPWDVVVHARRLAGDGIIGRLMDCPYCLSIWFAAPLSLMLDATFPGWVLAWLGVSGGASLVEKVVSRGEPKLIPVVTARPRTILASTPDGSPLTPNAPFTNNDNQEEPDGLLWEPPRRGYPLPHDRPLGVPDNE